MKTALLLVDIQNDYFPGGKMELVGSAAAAEKARMLLADFRGHGWPVAHIQHLSTRPDAGFFLPGTPGVAIHELVAPLDGETIITKNFPDSFQATGLADFLSAQAIEQLVIAGMMTHMCIDTTVRAAFARGYKCCVAQDACATRDLAFDGRTVAAQAVQDAFMAALASVFAKVATAETIMAELAAGD